MADSDIARMREQLVSSRQVMSKVTQDLSKTTVIEMYRKQISELNKKVEDQQNELNELREEKFAVSEDTLLLNMSKKLHEAENAVTSYRDSLLNVKEELHRKNMDLTEKDRAIGESLLEIKIETDQELERKRLNDVNIKLEGELLISRRQIEELRSRLEKLDVDNKEKDMNFLGIVAKAAKADELELELNVAEKVAEFDFTTNTELTQNEQTINRVLTK